MVSFNIQRIERDIEKYIPQVIQREVKDEIVKTITIIDCTLSHDMTFCKVYFTSFVDMDHKALEKEVNEAAGFIRHKLADIMEIRNTPELRFYYDTSIEYGQKIEDALKQIHENE